MDDKGTWCVEVSRVYFWNQTLNTQLKKMGFAQSTSDPCIYTSSKECLLILAVYVADIVLAGKSENEIAEVKSALAKLFQVNDMSAFLGVSVKQNPKTWVGQPIYTRKGKCKSYQHTCRSKHKTIEGYRKL